MFQHFLNATCLSCDALKKVQKDFCNFLEFFFKNVLDFYMTHLYGQNIGQRFKIENRVQNLQKAKLLILDQHLGTYNLIKSSNHRIVSSFSILTKFLAVSYYLLFMHAKLFNTIVNEPCLLKMKFLKISNTVELIQTFV
jgi:hypothetical protein